MMRPSLPQSIKLLVGREVTVRLLQTLGVAEKSLEPAVCNIVSNQLAGFHTASSQKSEGSFGGSSWVVGGTGEWWRSHAWAFWCAFISALS